MGNYLNTLTIKTNSKTPLSQVYIHKNLRFSVLCDKLLRVEIDESASFCDDATQAVINRNFCSTDFSVETSENEIIIETSSVIFCFDIKKKIMNYIILSDGRRVTDYNKGNLKGTKRTLDNVNGSTKLNDGIISTEGVALLDDSKSLILCENGKVIPRRNNCSDIYYFAYGYKYREAISDYFRLTGNPPLIPRFALGNWWSRYKAYTQEEYTELMNKFISKKIPITVATIDMDWHWVDVVKRFGKDAVDENQRNNIFELFYNLIFPGWTGYSWNTELFPEPEKFLAGLKNNGFKITMNLHPASGCKFYEDAYLDFCKFMDIDPDTKKQIRFDITDEKFIEGYFRFLHHPHEDSGVDFWWIDWQQGTNTAVKGLDPLWALNHYHFIDSGRNGKRNLILSRFAGAGSHRYPLGFSGDTVQTWESLDFQPYFTSTASNIGYSWWSHDIGGHCRGYRDDELYLRWLQYGVFSPIMRLHSTSNEFMGKEPWMYNKSIENISVDFLRLRHKLIPYIYSMNKKTASEGRCLIEPMYYESPKDPRAYQVPNQYYFGTELIVCPITKPCDKTSGVASTKMFLPKGRYTDILSDRIYCGNSIFKAFRDESVIPVLAKEGAIIPMYTSADSNSTANPDSLEILITRGNNSFALYEDDGETLNYKNGCCCETVFNINTTANDIVFVINKANGDRQVIPDERSYILNFSDIKSADSISITVNGKPYHNYSISENNNLLVRIDNLSVEDSAEIRLIDYIPRKSRSKKEMKIELLSKIKGNNDIKTALYGKLLKSDKMTFVSKAIREMLTELENLYY